MLPSLRQLHHLRSVLRILATPILIALSLFCGSAEAAWVSSNVPGQSTLTGIDSPNSMALARSARVLAVGSGTQASVTAINPDTGAVIATIMLPGQPKALAINSVGTRVYVVTAGSGNVLVLDLSSAKVVATWPLGGELSSLALKSDDSEVVVGDESGKRIVSVNPVTGVANKQLALAEAPIQLAYGQTDTRLLIGTKQGNLTTLDAGAWSLISNVHIGSRVYGLAWWQAGGLAIAVQHDQDGMTLVDVERGSIVWQALIDGNPNGITLNPLQGTAYASTADDFSANVVDLSAQSVKGRYTLQSAPGGMVFDAITQNLFVTQPKNNQIVRIDPAQSPLVGVLHLNKAIRDIKVNNVTHQAIAIARKLHELYILSLSDQSIKTIVLDGIPEHIALDTKKNLAIVALEEPGHRLVFVDLAAGTVFPEKIDMAVEALAVDEARGVSVVLGDEHKIYVVDNSTRKILSTQKLTNEYKDIAVHSGLGNAYLVSDGKKLGVFNLDTGTLSKEVLLGMEANHLAIDQALNVALLWSDNGTDVQRWDLKTLQAIATYTLPKFPTAIAIQADSHVAVVASKETNQVSLIDLQGNAISAGYTSLEKPSALDVSVRYNLALVLEAEHDEIIQVPLPNPMPILKDINPHDAPKGSPALTLKLTGEHFVDSSKVYFGSQILTTRWLSPSSLEADVPAALVAVGGSIAVTVQTPAPGGGTSQALTFNVLNPAPILTQLAPTSLQANGKTQILTVYGNQFIQGSQVFFGAQALVTVFVGTGQLSATVPGTMLNSSGTVPVTVFNPAPGGGTSAAISIAVTGALPTITGFMPTTGPIGTVVTITGTNFDAINPGANVVRFNGTAAVVSSASVTKLTVVVPIKATTGPISVTTQGGSATSSTNFTVQAQQDFDISLSATSVQAPQAGNGSVRVSLVSTGLSSYAQNVNLSVTGLPSGVTYQVSQALLYLNHDVILTFVTNGATAAGTYPVTIQGAGPVDLNTVSRSKPLSLQILAAGTTSVSGRVLHAEDDSPFINARVRLGGQATFTDSTGYYRLVNPAVAGDQVLLIDGATNNTAQLNYPASIAMPVMILAGQDNLALTSYIQAVDTSKYTTIVPGSEAHVTVPEIPNYELHIPAGAVLMGWNGTPITKVNVRTVPVDRLPIKPLPSTLNSRTVYLYYFFREGGANPSRPIPVTMNNDIDALPGEQVDLWYYDESTVPDPTSNQWRIMGKGTVSQDGKSIVSNPGVGIPKFCCGASTASRNSGGSSNNGANGGNGCGPASPNPVDLATGNNLSFSMRRFGIDSLLPLNLNCNYRSTNPRVSFFGMGTNFAYDWFAEQVGGQAVQITNPAGVRYMLSLQGDGVYRMTTGRSGALGMEVRPTAFGRTLRLQDGTEYDFNTTGQLLRIRDTNGNQISFTLDTNGFIQGIVDPTGLVYSFTTTRVTIGRTIYTLATKITDPLGRSISFTYDAQARMTSHTDAVGQTTSYTYDSGNRIATKTDARGGISSFQYDSAGRTIRETLPEAVTNSYQYTVSANTVTETRMTDGNGNVTTYRFNGLGFPVKTIDALGRTFSSEIDYATNLTLSNTDPLGRVTRYTYDDHGNRTSVVDPAGNTTIIEYDQTWNKPARITNALGFVTTLSYDNKGQLSKVVNAEGGVTTFTYNAQGRLASIKDGLGHTVSFAYDATGNLIRTTDALGNTAQARYDTANRLIEAITPKGRSTYLSYDALDRLLTRTDALGGKTQLAYDANDNPLSVVDANTHAIETAVYDLRNRLTARTDAAGKQTTYQYDANNNLTQLTDRKGQVTRIQYDAVNRLSQITDADSRVTQYSYDLAGNLAHIADSQSGDILLAYDNLNRLTQIVTNQGSVGYQYDALGRRTQRTLNGGDPTDYAYDRANRIKAINYRGKSVAYTYDAAGRLTQKTLPNGVSAHYAYDAPNRLTGISYVKPDATVLTSLIYTYDENGNRLSQSVNAKTETLFTATYDAANRMLTYNGYPLTYDANGNLIQHQTAVGPVSYTWDARNRLTAISGPSGTASFKYDALGRRIEKTVNGQTTQYLYDGSQAIAELQGSAIGATYLTGLQIDEVLARYNATGDRTLITDVLGSVLAQADASGTLQTQYGYSPYGETQATGTADANPVQYTGRENDQTGLYFYRARYYDPQLKRFISEDPIGLAGGVNQYAYVGGNPVSKVDPLGLWTVNIGISGSYVFPWGGAGTGFAGFVCDSDGNCGGYYGGGPGIGVGKGATGGVSVGASNAKTICDLRGRFTNVGVGGGWGPSGSGDGYWGPSDNGTVYGGGVTVGPGVGAGAFAGPTWTVVKPWFKL